MFSINDKDVHLDAMTKVLCEVKIESKHKFLWAEMIIKKVRW